MSIVSMLTSPVFHEGNSTVHSTLTDAIISQVQSCRDVPTNRSPAIIYDHARIVATIVPTYGGVHVISPDNGILTIRHEGDDMQLLATRFVEFVQSFGN